MWYAIKFLAVLFCLFILSWLIVGVAMTGVFYSFSRWPEFTIAGLFVAFLFWKEAKR